MQWIRLDTAFPRNHKILGVLAESGGDRAVLTYVFGLSYAGEQATDGFLPRECLPLIHGRAVDAKRLVAARLWIEEVGGWMINDWKEFQPSTAEMQARSDHARKAANSRWNGRG